MTEKKPTADYSPSKAATSDCKMMLLSLFFVLKNMNTAVLKLEVLSSNRKIFSRQARFAGSDCKQNHTLLDLCLVLCYIPHSQSIGKIEKVGRGLVGSMREKEIPLVTRPPFFIIPADQGPGSG